MLVTTSGSDEVFRKTTPKAMFAEFPALVALEPRARSPAPAVPRLSKPISGTASVPSLTWRLPSGVLFALMPAIQPGMVVSSTQGTVVVPSASKVCVYTVGPGTLITACAGVPDAKKAAAARVRVRANRRGRQRSAEGEFSIERVVLVLGAS